MMDNIRQPLAEFDVGRIFHITMEVISVSSVVTAIMQIVPAITACIGLVYWGVMLYRLLKNGEKK